MNWWGLKLAHKKMEIKKKKTDIKRLFTVPQRITVTKLTTKVVTDIAVYKDKQVIRVCAEVLSRCNRSI